ncbi:MAG: hypothetical protein JNJ83_23675 [Verrucomicrobiaceae bacterium]|nr:hypothetical protein [Verrucomicrobiaceae bacterium]
MEVFALTVFVSLMLAILFAALFVAERVQPDQTTVEQAALLPLDDEPQSPPHHANNHNL